MGQQNSQAVIDDDEEERNSGQLTRHASFDHDRKRQDSFIDERPRSVSFSDKISVVLIPSRSELESRRLIDMLWWTAAEFTETKKLAENEVVGALSMESTISLGDAVHLLYQPRCVDGHLILHVLVASHDARRRSLLFQQIKKAHKQAALKNRLLIQQACTTEEVYDKLEACVSFNAVFLDRSIVFEEEDQDLVEEVRARHPHTCIVFVRSQQGNKYSGGCDFCWTVDAGSSLLNEWKQLLQASELKADRTDYPILAAHIDEVNSDGLLHTAFADVPQSMLDAANSIHLACIVFDRSPPFAIRYVNEAWAVLSGRSAVEVIGQNIGITTGIDLNS
jgi:PAS domain-containing protein